MLRRQRRGTLVRRVRACWARWATCFAKSMMSDDERTSILARIREDRLRRNGRVEPMSEERLQNWVRAEMELDDGD